MKTFALAIAVAATCFAGPGAAVPLPTPEQIIRPEERSLMPRLLEALSSADAGEALERLDAVLPELHQPTPLRGFVQFLRATILNEQDREAEAISAVGESIRLLPNHSGPLLLASQILVFEDRSGEAADYLLRASRIDPESVNELDDYDINNLMSRLDSAGEKRRQIALSERLLEIGWSRGRPRTMSDMAMWVLEQRLAKGDAKGASAMVPRISSPSMLGRLLTEKQFGGVRPAVEAWAGVRLEKQWPIYLHQARAEWEASKDAEAGKAYAEALSSAGHHKTLVDTFLPLFSEKVDPERDFQLLFIATPLANALAHLGRWQEADSMFAKALTIWRTEETANAINLTANRARMLLLKGEFERGVEGLGQVLKDAEKWRGQVGFGALSLIHLYRACGLAQLGRRSEEITSEAIVASRRAVDPASYVYLQICKNDLNSAKKALIEALEVESTRSTVVTWMQPAKSEAFQSEFAKTMFARRIQLKQDAELIAATLKHGRILDAPLLPSVPEQKAALAI